MMAGMMTDRCKYMTSSREMWY